MDGHFRRIIQKADKFVRKKDYVCLFPGCGRKAIRGHAIPRASIIKALSDKGMVYTLEPSFNSLMAMTAVNSPCDVVEVGVNNASVFKGFCAGHDTVLFAAAETTDKRKRHMFISHHLRALTLEYCRKRHTAEYLKKLFALTGEPYFKETAEGFETFAELFRKFLLDSVFSPLGAVDYFCLPFSRNLQVSCCGCFQVFPEKFESAIAYNLISYADMSLLVLTTFKGLKHFLDTFLSGYKFGKNTEQLVNDLAFLKGEEPLIAPKLWRSLSEDEQLEVRLALRHPGVREERLSPTVIRLTPSHFPSEVTPAMAARLPPDLLQGLLQALERDSRLPVI